MGANVAPGTLSVSLPVRFRGRAKARRRECLCHSAAALLIGLATPLEVQWVGTLHASEILLAMVASWAVVTHLADARFWRPPVITLLAFLGVTLLAYMVADLVLGTEPRNLARGWARGVFLGSNFVGLYFLCRRNLFNILIYATASAAGTLAFLWFTGRLLDDWKFGASVPVTLIVAGLVPLVSGRAWMGALALALVGLLHIALDSREMGGNCLLAGLLLYARCCSAPRFKPASWALAGALALAGVGVFLYVNARAEEEHGQRRQFSNAWRTASLITAANAISDSPWLGNGSQANNFELQSLYDSIFAERSGVRYHGQQTDTSTFSPHSQILQAWFEAGVFGAAFFLYLGWKLLEALSGGIFRRDLDAFSALFAFCLLRAVWHLLFSPFAGLARLDVALAAVIVCALDLRGRAPAVFAR
jgi:O-antigen ligase